MFPHSLHKYIYNPRHQLGRQESIPRVSHVSVENRHASPVYGENMMVRIGHWNRGPHTEKGCIQIALH